MFMLTNLLIWLLVLPYVFSVCVSNQELVCPYPPASLIRPCSCEMQPECYFNEEEGKMLLLGSFSKSLKCYAPFSQIGDSFDYNNHIAYLYVRGKHDGKYFLSKEDLGRLNVTELEIGTQYSNSQELFEPGVFNSSYGSLQSLMIFFSNHYKVQESGGHIKIDYLKTICQNLLTFVVYGVSYIRSEDFEGCSQLKHLKIMESNLAIIGSGFFEHLPSIEYFEFSSFAKLWIQTGAFENLQNLTTVKVYQENNEPLYCLNNKGKIVSCNDENSDQYNQTEIQSEYHIYNQTIVSKGAFNTLPSLTTLQFSKYGYDDYLIVDIFEELPFLGLIKLREFKYVNNGDHKNLPRLFDDAPNLKSFKFQSGLQVVEMNAFQGLSSLTKIDLSDNNIHSLNNAIGNLPHLELIDLSNNQLTSISSVFLELPLTKETPISGVLREDSELPSTFFDVPALNDIILKGNKKLTAINEDFFKLITTAMMTGRLIHIYLEDIPLDCGCEVRWFFRVPIFQHEHSYSRHFSGAKCVGGGPLNKADRTLMDIHNSYDYALENDDLKHKSILDLTCPPDEED